VYRGSWFDTRYTISNLTKGDRLNTVRYDNCCKHKKAIKRTQKRQCDFIFKVGHKDNKTRGRKRAHQSLIFKEDNYPSLNLIVNFVNFFKLLNMICYFFIVSPSHEIEVQHFKGSFRRFSAGP